MFSHKYLFQLREKLENTIDRSRPVSLYFGESDDTDGFEQNTLVIYPRKYYSLSIYANFMLTYLSKLGPLR